MVSAITTPALGERQARAYIAAVAQPSASNGEVTDPGAPFAGTSTRATFSW